MATFRVIVKGTPAQATMRALKDDLRIKEMVEDARSGCVMGLVEATHEVITRWFCEDPSRNPPFLPGTLLHYREWHAPTPRTCRHCGALVPMAVLSDIGHRAEFEVCPKCSRTYEGYLVI